WSGQRRAGENTIRNQLRYSACRFSMHTSFDRQHLGARGGEHADPMNWSLRARRLLGRLTFAQQLILLALLPATVATLGAIAVLTQQHLNNVGELMRANAQTVALQVATMSQSQ